MKKHLFTTLLSVAVLVVLPGCFGDKKETAAVEASMPMPEETGMTEQQPMDMEESAAPVEEAK